MNARITNNVNPTYDDVLEWGYDEDYYFMEQDEDLLLYGLDYVLALLELAQDPACPKQSYALCIISQFARMAALHRKPHDLQGLEQIIHALQSTEPSVLDWQHYVRRLLIYQQHPLMVGKQKAWNMAQDLLLGIGRIGTVKQEKHDKADTWHFSLTTSIQEHLFINRRTGIYTYERAYLQRSNSHFGMKS
ncbi:MULTISPECIES: hypothetical protein [unclassified Leptolyngbya]|uniref:hypothetical protein n=1 Tax=unclassified Leptolyngbya TaxID=2650499 RepID=UPI001686214C|nr:MULTISPECIES: hypothetical protein [unclassified Leptolyngbya]MBD1911719.1 hypothetical protein [Leptolyngbya sp. FACHB-8]MBD2155554.1 hypothetical protein [Leptolyngbya sp. FACHB-16]